MGDDSRVQINRHLAPSMPGATSSDELVEHLARGGKPAAVAIVSQQVHSGMGGSNTDQGN
ncbi:hypothetical protein E2562_000170 [Oryza meyeriana var. granulata]|uniref:Uncharacterized protein n=1 Tax=Oryza meyeriana var. granulata TaxID=110450 RepID=A0A6G1DBM8_9ORYZ|nr:hypothetical protein E2562_000170 [Oryza meyeriana var. granulata]